MAEEGTKARPLPAVLLVDDEPLLLDSLAQELQGSCRVTTAASAAEADLKLAARRYDVIVCDHMLPGEQGLDFLSRALELMPSTKRILMTGYTSPEFIGRSIAIAGLSACLVKPVRASEIAAAIRAALAS
jgi:DNA-binding NarL/FixJ family response regulator